MQNFIEFTHFLVEVLCNSTLVEVLHKIIERERGRKTWLRLKILLQVQ